jgi:phosphate transport system permease protein
MALSTPAANATIGADVVRARLRGKRADVTGTAFKAALVAALATSVVVLAVLIADVLMGSWSVFSTRPWDFLNGTLRTSPEEAGLFQGIRGTFWIGVFVVVLAFPIGIGAAIYLEEYAPRSRLTRFIDINIRNLAGVPSVVYGILGFAIFVKSLESLPDWLGGGRFTGGRTVMAAGITLAILVLPIVIISAEAIRAVPDSIREAGFAVGATRWEVVRSHVLPYAAPGVLTGTVLALARALGEAAPLILVGAVTGRLGSGRGTLLDPGQLQERFTALPIVITQWAGQPQAGFQDSLAPAAIVVLLVLVLLANSTAILLRNRYDKKR